MTGYQLELARYIGAILFGVIAIVAMADALFILRDEHRADPYLRTPATTFIARFNLWRESALTLGQILFFVLARLLIGNGGSATVGASASTVVLHAIALVIQACVAVGQLTNIYGRRWTLGYLRRERERASQSR